MILYTSDYLEVNLNEDILIQKWTDKPLSVDVFQREIINFTKVNEKVKGKSMLWLQEQLNFVIPEKLFAWLEDVTKRQFKLGIENLLFTIPKRNDQFNSLLSSFNDVDTTYHPKYFTSKENAYDFLERKKKEKSSIITNLDVELNNTEVDFNFKVKPEKAQLFMNHIHKLKTIEPFYDVYLENYITLTDREKQVFDLIISGYTNLKIAEKLFVSNETIKSHRKVILRKLQIKNLNDWLIYGSLFGDYKKTLTKTF